MSAVEAGLPQGRFASARPALFVFFGCFVAFIRADGAYLGCQRIRHDDAVVGVIALGEPVAGRTGAARLAIGLRRFAEQPLGEVLREVKLADPRLAVQQQRVWPVAAQLLKTLPVVGLPRIYHF